MTGSNISTKLMPDDKAAAHQFLSELRTRISTQPLPYQYGVEARALESLWEVFAQARAAMKDHPECMEFARVATQMLNVDLRPVTAKWHRAHSEGRLKSRDGSNEFRADLEAVQGKLREFAKQLHLMAYGTEGEDKLTPSVLTKDELDKQFGDVSFGISPSLLVSTDKSIAINQDEAAAVAARRKKRQVQTAAGINAVGLGLSGGGIRSATFCLGVTQVLAERELLKDVDFLSTVSGGGYVGCFLTSRLGNQEPYTDFNSPHGPDPDPIRYLRQHAKYLTAIDLKQRWSMVTATLAGMLLNWTAPVLMIAVAALIAIELAQIWSDQLWPLLLAISGGLTLVALLLYAGLIRFGPGPGSAGGWSLGVTVALTLFIAACWGLSAAYGLVLRWSGGAGWGVAALLGSAGAAIPTVVRFVPVLKKPAVRVWVLKAALMLAGIVVPIGAVALLFMFYRLGTLPPDSGAAWWSPMHHGGLVVLVTITIFCAVVALVLLNINLTAPHRIYRDALARTFVQHREKDATPFPLKDINSQDSAPYHLINATLNVPSSTHEALRERKSDFFLFSKKWCGAPSVGYYRTEGWMTNRAPADLATAMAISGAAASSYMGLGSMPTLTALGVGMSEDKDWLNLSDGGHIENMAIYELLRRRCKFIISVDGEADPTSTFQGHLTLVRHAQIDFGIRIEPELTDLRPDLTSKLSQSHTMMCRVHYPRTNDQPAGIGFILYLKLSVTGNELELIKRYRTLNPDFPHQSTLDQFFDEEQFEAYRQLGVHVAEGLFARALLGDKRRPATVKDWFRSLATNLLLPEGQLTPAGGEQTAH